VDVRKKWISDSSDYSSKEEIISDVKSNYDIRRYYSAEGKSVIIDDVVTQVIIQSHLNPLNRDKVDNIIHMPIEAVANTGSIVEWENDKWIIVSNINDLQAYKTASMIKSNNTLKFYSNNINDSTLNTLYQIPCVVGKGNIGLDVNKFMSLASDEYLIVCPSSVDSLKIDLNTRFILSGSAYAVLGVSNIENVGLLTIRIKENSISADDNEDLGIANYYSHQVVKEIYILNGTEASLLYTNATLQLSILCKENGVIVSNPIVAYSSANLGIATISNTGLITCVGTGDVIIVANFGNASASITIHGNINQIDNYNIVITPTDSTLKLSRSIELTASAMNNGIVDLTRSFVWSIYNLDESSSIYANITPNDKTCTVLASSSSSASNKYIIVRASLSYDSSIYTEKQIKIINLF